MGVHALHSAFGGPARTAGFREAAVDTDDLEKPIMVTSATIACDGGGGPLGHPRVFLTMDGDGRVVCPYCSRTFVLADGAGNRAGH